MEKKIKAAVVGDKSRVAMYAAAGVAVYHATERHDVLKLIQQLDSEGYGIIFVSEPVYAECEDGLKKYVSQPYPIIIPVPDENSDGSYARQRIAENVKKAIGSDII
ncbi:MAG: hypothetical protein II135_06460 [Clostridia bacterium]|nr:hypothetical protein [Clostridia bacterium]MBQ3869340.1 hypothetical protein [Clostridia bacterium]